MTRYVLALIAGLLLPVSIHAAVGQSLGISPPLSAGHLPAQPGSGSAMAGAVGEYVQLNGGSLNSSSASISNSSPAVITASSNTLPLTGCKISAPSSGILCVPAVYFTGLGGSVGISNSTTYYVDPNSINTTSKTFQIATSIANAIAGTDVNTTGTDSGTVVQGAYLGTSGTALSLGSVYLTPGDWRCNGTLVVSGAGSTVPTQVGAQISTTANAISAIPLGGFNLNATFGTGALNNSFPLSDIRQSLSSQTLIYLNGQMTWTGGLSNPVMGGFETCWRTE